MPQDPTPFQPRPMSARALDRVQSDIQALNARSQAIEEILVARMVAQGGCASFQNLFTRLGVRTQA